ncbi:hypothetical protein [Phenylobacterium zucineum]|uniref:hypothetical protein n=1 Tax=Phenylobacterium zucineum TaxID=284016 RepID=UPI0002E473E8|nr:hypothetical protein [Phenylobacterium zucineum]
MNSLAPAAQIAAIAAAVSGPFLAGLAVVMWSKARAARRQQRLAELEGDLRGLYGKVAEDAVPERLAMVVDALEEGQALKPAGKAADSKAPA